MNDFDTSSAATSAAAYSASAAYAAHTATAPSGRRARPDRAGQARVIALDHAASLSLPAGSHWVLQAWSEARMNLTTARVGITNDVSAGTAAIGSGSNSDTGWMQRLVAATHQAWRHHTRQPSAQAGVGLTGAGCS